MSYRSMDAPVNCSTTSSLKSLYRLLVVPIRKSIRSSLLISKETLRAVQLTLYQWK